MDLLTLIQGDPFRLLLSVLILAIGKNSVFKKQLRSLLSVLESLQRRALDIQNIGEYISKLDRGNNDVQELGRQIVVCTELVSQLSNNPIWKNLFISVCGCGNITAQKLAELEASLKMELSCLALSNHSLNLEMSSQLRSNDLQLGNMQRSMKVIMETVNSMAAGSNTDFTVPPNNGSGRVMVLQGSIVNGGGLIEDSTSQSSENIGSTSQSSEKSIVKERGLIQGSKSSQSSDNMDEGAYKCEPMQASKMQWSKWPVLHMVRLSNMEKVMNYYLDLNLSDNLSDEDLRCFLEKQVLKEKAGLSQKTITDRLRTKEHEPGTTGEPDSCSICMGEYKDQDEIGSLDYCSHVYHADCIKERLTKNNICPKCGALAIIPEEYPYRNDKSLNA